MDETHFRKVVVIKSGCCSPLEGAHFSMSPSALVCQQRVLVFFRAHSLVSVHHHRYLNMAIVSLRNSASSLLLFSRRLFSPGLKAQCLYHIKVVDHYENPRNVGTLDKNSKNVGTGLVGAPACGDVMKLQIEVDDHGMIVDAKFKTFGCGSAIASSSLATEWVKGKSVEEALKIRNTDIAKELCLPPVKLHCSMLAEDAIKAALSDYRIKQQDKKEKCVQATG
ncbi:iron-sulfur cluster assembly enzyme ISCU, mitochondrial [Gymnodraco acuticeps]|uniref:Iron-sulfur cluster assembly enzyme ISCU n=1 Tax=Gymnodraco acuticeps TaxID=8218 RepID=A0A6P8WAW4_GYMAC|nr:iron-sulfur cluster assembly enzyme ISCU, mitochondrial [Gymnodraco acuticeps]